MTFIASLKKITFSTVLCTALSCSVASTLLAQGAQPSNATLTREDQALVAQIANNPQLLEAALEQFQKNKASRIASLIRSNQDLLNRPEYTSFGDPRAPIVIYEFVDFTCSYCKRANQTVMQLLKNNRDVRLVTLQLPILGADGKRAARASIAARQYNKDKELYLAIFNIEGRVTASQLKRAVEKVGLNWDMLSKNMSSSYIDQEFSELSHLARLLGVTGTPAFIIGTSLIPGAVSLQQLEQLVQVQRLVTNPQSTLSTTTLKTNSPQIISKVK